LIEGVESPSNSAGSVSNGITTADWSVYTGALIFPDAQPDIGAPACEVLGPEKVTTCACAEGPRGRSVCGSKPFTDFSDICTAAGHAGVIGPDGGLITVKRVLGQANYEGSTRNGVATPDFGPCAGSFDFRLDS
jgi:hypothetical protein